MVCTYDIASELALKIHRNILQDVLSTMEDVLKLAVSVLALLNALVTLGTF